MGPLKTLDQWDEFVQERYKPDKSQDEFRRYDDSTPAVVRDFYRLNHTHQTVDFVRAKKREYVPRQKAAMGIWDAMARLETLVDDSDPDTSLSQMEHNLQTAEAIRRDGHPRWFILTGFIHDLGKVLCLFGEQQWAVVGDTFPVGCEYSDKIVFPQFFRDNPDAQVPEYQTRLGIYKEGCGLDNVDLSWGHDEYLYHVAKDYLPEPALYMIRYHSFYPAHREGAYGYLMNDRDRDMFDWVRTFGPYDLYSKGTERPKLEDLKPYYEALVSEFFPTRIAW